MSMTFVYVVTIDKIIKIFKIPFYFLNVLKQGDENSFVQMPHAFSVIKRRLEIRRPANGIK